MPGRPQLKHLLPAPLVPELLGAAHKLLPRHLLGFLEQVYPGIPVVEPEDFLAMDGAVSSFCNAPWGD